MRTKQRRIQTCPACHETKSVNTKMADHLYEYCKVVKQLKRDAQAGLLSIQEVSARVSEYVSTWKSNRSGKLCGCSISGSNFCQRIVRLIQWDNKIIHYVIETEKKRKAGYVRFVLLETVR
jgi:hypothetical protein